MLVLTLQMFPLSRSQSNQLSTSAGFMEAFALTMRSTLATSLDNWGKGEGCLFGNNSFAMLSKKPKISKAGISGYPSAASFH